MIILRSFLPHFFASVCVCVCSGLRRQIIAASFDIYPWYWPRSVNRAVDGPTTIFRRLFTAPLRLSAVCDASLLFEFVFSFCVRLKANKFSLFLLRYANIILVFFDVCWLSSWIPETAEDVKENYFPHMRFSVRMKTIYVCIAEVKIERHRQSLVESSFFHLNFLVFLNLLCFLAIFRLPHNCVHLFWPITPE